jgi:hypothetical protein
MRPVSAAAPICAAATLQADPFRVDVSVNPVPTSAHTKAIVGLRTIIQAPGSTREL